MNNLIVGFHKFGWSVLCICALIGQSTVALKLSPLFRLESRTSMNIFSKTVVGRLNPLYQSPNEQSTEEFKISSQIARLNAVAAKLRAEAAELEVPSTM